MEEIQFPVEFLVHGTAVSFQGKNSNAKEEWKARVQKSSKSALPHDFHFIYDGPVSVTLYNFPDEPMRADVDNIVKLVIDALKGHVYCDDKLVERVVAQKFEPGSMANFKNPSDILLEALASAPPVLYVRISNTPSEELP